MNAKSVDEIIEKCKGEQRIAYELNIHQQTVCRWRKFGIPEDRWTAIRGLYEGDLSGDDLHLANEQLRAQKDGEEAA